MMIYTQTSFRHKKKKTKSKKKLAETSAYWEWRKKHGSMPKRKKKDTSTPKETKDTRTLTTRLVTPRTSGSAD